MHNENQLEMKEKYESHLMKRNLDKMELMNEIGTEKKDPPLSYKMHVVRLKTTKGHQ